jgi:Antimicrobial peptide resistance and lipid A acylation protein PagP
MQKVTQSRGIALLSRPLLALMAIGMAGFHCPPACSGEFSLLLNGKAIHLNPPEGNRYNEENWGAGLQYDFSPRAGHWVPFVNASQFRDSNENNSPYMGGGIARRWWPVTGLWGGHIDLGALAFVMRREQFRDGHWFPGLLPVLSIGGDRVALNVTFIPKVDPKMVPLLFLQLKVTLP